MRKKHILITGSYGNLGRALAEHLADEHTHLFLQGREWDKEAAGWAHELNAGSITLLNADLRSISSIDTMCEQVHTETEYLDVLINNAGVQDICELETMPGETWQRMFDVNLRAAHLLTQHFSGLKSDHNRRCIINILSIEAEHPAVGHSHYAASKGGLLQYSRAAALELGPRGIRVNAVSPGLIERDGIHEQWPEGVQRYLKASPLKRLISPADVAHAVDYLIAAEAVTGINLVVDAGIGTVTGY
jgi:NAD(P)-dependent dehydrogenase (short-subunit alcohol dehydrogenase family)